MKREKTSKGKKILITTIINLIILVFLFINPIKIPTEIINDTTTNILKIKSNVENKYKVSTDTNYLNSMAIKVLNINKKNKGEIYISIYNPENVLIYSNAYKLNNDIYPKLIIMNFEKQKKYENKSYYIEIKTRNFNEKDYINIVGVNNGTKKIKAPQIVVQTGAKESYIPTIICFVILFVNLLNLFRCNEKRIKFDKKKISIIIYFISWLLTIYLAFRLMYSYVYYEKYISIFYVVSMLVLGFISSFFGGVILFKDKLKNKLKYENIFLVLLIPLSMLYGAFVLYGNVPDEIAHYNRANQIANLEIIKTDDSYLPDILSERKTSYFGIVESYKNRIEKEEPSITPNTGANYYNPILYLHSSIAIKITNIFDIPVVYGFYIVRVVNLILFVILGYISLKIIPIGKFLLLVYMSNPMVLQQAASVSADCIINSTIILFISYVLYLKDKAEPLNKKNILILLILSCYVLVGKYAYAPMLLLLLLLKNQIKQMSKNKKLILYIGLIAVLLYFVIGFILMKYVPSSLEIENTKFVDEFEFIGDNKSHLAQIISNPLQYIYVIYNTILSSTTFYLYSFLGGFPGSLEFQITPYISSIYLMILIITVLSEKHNNLISKKDKYLFGVILFIVINAIFFAFYDALTQLNGLNIGGIQGRYYIPVVILLLLMLIKNKSYDLKNKNLIYFGLIFVNLYTIYHIINFYI